MSDKIERIQRLLDQRVVLLKALRDWAFTKTIELKTESGRVYTLNVAEGTALNSEIFEIKEDMRGILERRLKNNDKSLESLGVNAPVE